MEKLEFFKLLLKLPELIKKISVNKFIFYIMTLFIFARLFTTYYYGEKIDISLEETSLLVEIITYAIVLLLFLISHTSANKKKKNIVMDTIEKANEINKWLEVLRGRQKADYLSVSLFHNGDVTFNRVHLLKMSRLFEAYGKDQVSRISVKTTESYPLLPFYNAVMEISSKGYLYIPNAKKCEDATLADTLNYFNIESALYVPIYSENEFIGFMCWEWEKKTEFDTKRVNAIRNEIKLIQHYF